jgi:hypothetical protein
MAERYPGESHSDPITTSVPSKRAEGGRNIDGGEASNVERGYLEGKRTTNPRLDMVNFKSVYSVGPEDPMYPYLDTHAYYHNSNEPKNGAELRMRDRKAPGMLIRPWPPDQRS